MRLTFYFLILLFFYTEAKAQEIIRCGSTAYEKMLEANVPSYKKSIERMESILQAKKGNLRSAADVSEYTIPVVVHVLYNSSASNISNDRIFSQIKIINDDYSRKNADTVNTPAQFRQLGGNARLKFVLANRDPDGNVTNGIIRKYVTNKSFLVDDYTQDTLLKSISRWPSDQYLNIWVTSLTNNNQNKVLGYTFNPSSGQIPDLYADVESKLDGVVVDYTTFGIINSTSKYNLGRTTTHEIGHWLGLRHIWGDTYCGNDFVDDTPPQEDDNLDLNKEECSHYSNCTNSTTLDMSANYMDYSPDKCMNIFTKGQVQRMRTVMESNDRRVKIQSSSGYCEIPDIGTLPIFQDFENTLTDLTWTTISSDNFIINHTNTGTFSQGNYSMEIGSLSPEENSFAYYQSKPIDFLKTENPVLEFSVFYNPPLTSSSDSLVISYNSNCHNFVHLKTLYAQDFSIESTSSSSFPNLKDWKSFKINLSLLQEKVAQLRFGLYLNTNNKLFLDDINLYNAKKDLQLLLFPNPVIGQELTAELTYEKPVKAEFTIYSSQGLLLKKIIVDSKDFRKKLVVSELANGMYLLKMEAGGKIIVKKFIVVN